MDISDKRITIIQILYRELRNYRDKEFKVFIFSFPIIGIGFIPKIDTTNWPIVLILITVFAYVMIRYLYKNHKRMLNLKKEIVSFQEKEEINNEFIFLNPKKWIEKSTENHLGTWTFIGLLFFEIIAVWGVYILLFMKK